MSYTLSQFFQDISKGQYEVLSIDLQLNGFKIAALQQELQRNNSKTRPLSDEELEKLVDAELSKFLKKNWTRFNIMIVSYLQYCRDVNPWSIWESCDLIFLFYQNLNNCLLNDSYQIDPLVPLFKELTEYVIPIAMMLDDNYMTIGTRKFQFLSFTSSIISKLFNSIKPSRTHEGNSQDGNNVALPEKQRILLYLVNKLNNIYFRIGSPQLCSNIFNNFKPKCSVSKFSEYPIKERIEYRYLLGRYYLLNNRITNAFLQLNNAFNQLSALANLMELHQSPQIKRNFVRILKYLIPAGLMIGKLPRFWLVSNIDRDLSDKYYQLAQLVRAGNISGLNMWLKQHERVLCKNHLLLTLLEKLPMLTYRYLVKIIMQEIVIPQHTGKLPYSVIESAMRISIGDTAGQTDTIDIYSSINSPQNVENVLVTLINLGFLRGNCFPLLKICVVKKTPVINEILPSIQDRVITSFALNVDDSWLDD